MIKMLKNSLLVLFVMSISACSYSPSLLKEMYSEFPEDVSGEIKEAISLTPGQSANLDEYVHLLMQWHRRQKLPRYSQRFAILANRVRQGAISENDLNTFFEELDRFPHLKEATHLTHKLALIAQTLNDAQIRQLDQFFKQQYAEETAEIRKQNLSASTGEDLKSIFEFVNIKLSEQQLKFVKKETNKLYDLRWQELEVKTNKDKQLIALLRNINNSQFIPQFNRLWNSGDELPTNVLRQKEQQNKKLMTQLMTNLIKGFSAEQRRQFVSQLMSLSKTFGEMAR